MRKHCRRLGIDTSHLVLPSLASAATSNGFTPQPEHLRAAGPHLVAAALTLAGYAVSHAPEGMAYDLVVDLGSEGLRRVQVKTTTRRANGTWVCQMTRTEYRKEAASGHVPAFYCAEDVDLFACVDGSGAIYLIPIKAVEGRTGIHLRRYDAFRLPLRLVGLTGLEPATFGPPDRRATKLRHSPFGDETTGGGPSPT